MGLTVKAEHYDSRLSVCLSHSHWHLEGISLNLAEKFILRTNWSSSSPQFAPFLLQFNENCSFGHWWSFFFSWSSFNSRCNRPVCWISRPPATPWRLLTLQISTIKKYARALYWPGILLLLQVCRFAFQHQSRNLPAEIWHCLVLAQPLSPEFTLLVIQEPVSSQCRYKWATNELSVSGLYSKAPLKLQQLSVQICSWTINNDLGVYNWCCIAGVFSLCLICLCYSFSLFICFSMQYTGAVTAVPGVGLYYY